MRRSGLLATACLVSLENRQRLARDPQHANGFAQAIKNSGFDDKSTQFATNMVCFLDSRNLDREWVGEVEVFRICADFIGRGFVRLVTHLDLRSEDRDEVYSRMGNFRF